MKNCSYICGVSAKDKHNLTGCGFFISASGEHRNHGLPVPSGFCTVRLEIVFAEIGDSAALFLHPYYNFSFMAKTMKDCNGAQGASNATSTHDTGIYLNVPPKVLEALIELRGYDMNIHALPFRAMDTLSDLREDGGAFGDDVCTQINEIIHYLIDDSMMNLTGDVHTQRLQSLKNIYDLIQRLSK